MKNEFLSSYPELKKEELQQLCAIVKETLSDIDLPPAKEKKSGFGIADLWNMQKNMITAGKRWNSGFRIYYVRG